MPVINFIYLYLNAIKINFKILKFIIKLLDIK